MYQVLYRKWRPGRFSDVIGQPQVTVTLRNEVKENRLSHAYLFTGSRGTGKTSCAKILAKAVSCTASDEGNPCCKCEICKGIDSGAILDVVEIDAASNRGIDDIRALREEAFFTPALAKYRVYIIDEVHMLTIEAFNALLKTLEEPPEHVIFILATTEVQKLPATILSRCQRFDFRRIPPEIIAERLQYIAEKEKYTIDREAAMLIARIADGAARDALSLLERCFSSGNDITVKAVTAAAGLMDREYLFALSAAIRDKNAALALSTADELHSASCDTERLITELTGHFRDLMVVKSVKNPAEMLPVTESELDLLKQRAGEFTAETILRAITVLGACSDNMKRSRNGRIEAETALIRLCGAEVDSDITALLQRISELEKKVEVLSVSGSVGRGVSSGGVTPIDAPFVPLPDTPYIPPIETGNYDIEEKDESVPFDIEPPNPYPQRLVLRDDYPNPFEDALPFDDDDEADNMDNLSFLDGSAPENEEKNENKPDNLKENPRETLESAKPGIKKEKTAAKKASPAKGSFSDWPKITAEAKRLSPPLNGMIDGSSADVNGEILTVKTENPMFKQLFNVETYKSAIKKAVLNVTGREYDIRI
ncbi:MAG: DNA polymerase III subunit gamma/tau [Oscillospiraceae bacterium]|nr:DNA polymerase III subunit gamma/tau [Oscillospiraceae bacterium]